MAGTETLTINFQASGDKDLIAAFKGIAQAQKQVAGTSSKLNKAFKTLLPKELHKDLMLVANQNKVVEITTKKITLTVRQAVPAY